MVNNHVLNDLSAGPGVLRRGYAIALNRFVMRLIGQTDYLLRVAG
jgi:hypothetical protein